MLETFQGEIIYIWYYFDIQLRQIFVYWILGMVGIRNEHGECSSIYGIFPCDWTFN